MAGRRALRALTLAPGAAALCMAAFACASGPGAGPAVGAAAGAEDPLPPLLTAFQRDVHPFVVLDETGRAYDFPFLGGLLAPRPQFVDIDGDGDLDLFVQEYTNDLWFFENVGTREAPRYEWRTDRFHDLDIGEWYRFVDIDGDGLIDLLAEEPFSYVRYYRNEGTGTDPRFVLVDSLRDAEGQPIVMDRQNIPAVVDLDCSGRLDLFVGRVEGTVARYKAERPGSERFVFLTEFWEGIEIIGQFGPVGLPGPGGNGSGQGEAAAASGQHRYDGPGGVSGPSAPAPTLRHGANSLTFADFDGDGDLDLFWGDFFEPGVLLIQNIGRTCSSPSFQVQPVPLPFADSVQTSGYNAPAPVDFNGNGQLDFLMGVLGGAFNPIRTAAENFYHWERVAPDRFELRTRRFLNGIDVGSESVPALVDLYGNGVLDLVVGGKIDPRDQGTGLLYVFRNEGTPTDPRLRLADTLRLASAYHQAPAFGDLYGNGLPDLLIGTWNGEILHFRNEGTRQGPRFVQDTAATLRLPRGSNATPALVDIDGDGTLDLFVGQSNGGVAFYRNEGTPERPSFTLVTERVDDLVAGRRSAPAFVDVDGDGLLDLVVGREAGGLAVYRNVGSAAAPRFVEHEGLSVRLPPMSAPAFGDLTGDGLLDLVSGTVSGGVVFYRGARAGG